MSRPSVKEQEFVSLHKLDFEYRPWHQLIPDQNLIDFRVGTVTGLYGYNEKSYEIICIINSSPGNGHFEDVLQYFERSCRRDNRSLKILELWNQKFKQHLIEKRGFINYEGENVVKHFL